MKPNILLIMTDQMRGDCIGAVGHPDIKTPYLDTLVSQGTVYPNAYTACPSCVAARAALHTGLKQEHHGRVGYKDRVDWDYDVTMAGELAKAGYYTQCVGKMHVHPLRNTVGFHNIELHDGYLHNYRYRSGSYSDNQLHTDDYFYWLKNEKGIEADVTDTGIDCNSWVTRPWIYEEKYHPTNWATTRSIDFLRRRDPRKPFFLMTSYVRPHAPYDAPQVYFDMYKDKKLTPPVVGDWDNIDELNAKGRIFNSSTGPMDPELIREQQAGYYACITHIDHQIGRLIQSLIEYELYDNTIIIFTSDHGELLSDHSLSRKIRPYQGSIHIPMIVRGKGIPQSVNNNIVELRDVMATTLDIAEVQASGHIDGISMLTENNGREYLHGEHENGPLSNQWIVTKTDKLCWYSQTGKEEYFCLDTDPNETHNAIADETCQERIQELRTILIGELKGREEGFTDGKSLIAGCDQVSVLKNTYK
ncbi:MAG: arylsulfatase [Lachnospiraceae bacterium]